MGRGKKRWQKKSNWCSPIFLRKKVVKWSTLHTSHLLYSRKAIEKWRIGALSVAVRVCVYILFSYILVFNQRHLVEHLYNIVEVATVSFKCVRCVECVCVYTPGDYDNCFSYRELNRLHPLPALFMHSLSILLPF